MNCTVLGKGCTNDGRPVLRLEASDGAIHLTVPRYVWEIAEVGAEVDVPVDDPTHPAASLYVKLELP